MIASNARGAPETKRPRILGVARMDLFVSDLSRARAFYEGLLGYGELYALKDDKGADRIAFVKINEDQYIELSSDTPRNDGRLDRIAIYTDSASAMRDYLISRGIKVPDKVTSGMNGDLEFTITDPDGHTLQIVQYEPASRTMSARGKFMPDARVSGHIYHVGVTVRHLAPTLDFYQAVLGFREFWRGSASGKVLSWVNMRVPDGDDYVELMLYSEPQTEADLGVKNHICLLVEDLDKTVATLRERAPKVGYSRPIEIRTGRNGKRQANLFDPDGTRVEIMEPQPADGRPVPSSTAPPPG